MSRSYKKTPYAGDTKTKWAKRKAKRIAKSKMNMEESPSPALYKRYGESWDICDYYSIFTLHRWMRNKWNLIRWADTEITEEEKIQEWYKWYKRK